MEKYKSKISLNEVFSEKNSLDGILSKLFSKYGIKEATHLIVGSLSDVIIKEGMNEWRDEIATYIIKELKDWV